MVTCYVCDDRGYRGGCPSCLKVAAACSHCGTLASSYASACHYCKHDLPTPPQQEAHMNPGESRTSAQDVRRQDESATAWGIRMVRQEAVRDSLRRLRAEVGG